MGGGRPREVVVSEIEQVEAKEGPREVVVGETGPWRSKAGGGGRNWAVVVQGRCWWPKLGDGRPREVLRRWRWAKQGRGRPREVVVGEIGPWSSKGDDGRSREVAAARIEKKRPSLRATTASQTEYVWEENMGLT